MVRAVADLRRMLLVRESRLSRKGLGLDTPVEAEDKEGEEAGDLSWDAC